MLLVKKGGSSLRSVTSDTTLNADNVVLSEKPVKYSMLYPYDLLQCESGDDILSKAIFRYYLFHVLNSGKTVEALAEGYQVEILGLVTPSCYWVTLVSNRARGEYWITSNDKRFVMDFNFPKFIEGKRNIVSLETILPKLLEKAEKFKKRTEKNKKRKHPIYY